ncbi:GH116 family glycosyl hydrolase [Chamaesiphon sp.]|uniref:GH116 family glycosyl hydrolase n=1 Tax=Chamaesiphon sp. TaxID=2814140 RepID=UPI0035942692
MLEPSPRPSIPTATWQRQFHHDWDKPYTVRYESNLDDGPFHGMPLGGFGAGCIGRSHRGEFNLWHIDGGEHVFKNLFACQFSVFEQSGNGDTQAYAMSTQVPEDGSLDRWQWYPQTTSAGQGTGTYQALYPRSWYAYENVFQAQLTCEQFSPIWADNYQETSYPIAIFEWTAHNPTDKPITLSILLSWENTVGWFANTNPSSKVEIRDDGSPVYDYQPRIGESEGNYNQRIVDNYRVGCLLDRAHKSDVPSEGEGQWSIASIANPSVEVFYHSRWNPIGNGREIWDSFAADGSLPDIDDESVAKQGERIAAAITIRFTVKPGQTKKIPFTLAWDFPITEFGKGINYYRRYTDFFGRSGENSWAMVRTAFKHYDTWQQQIINWQQPILDRSDLPDWFKMALFNELYLLTDGGTLWTAADDRDPVGQFGVLECLDYRWYESLDVRLYGSFSVLLLWPKLEKSILIAFARAIHTEDTNQRLIGYYVQTAFGYEDRPQNVDRSEMMAPRKTLHATPHDLGAPNEHPWEKTNYTCYQDCNLWKDLGSDFVLQVYRAYIFTDKTDLEFLAECWTAIVDTLAYLKQFDLDNDGMIENSGAPDQTFDDWRLQGISAYCGGLWLAALEAAIAIGQILSQQYHGKLTPKPTEIIPQYQAWLDTAKPIYQQQLWNGSYYRIDTGSSSAVVMADQLCGQFYAKLLELDDIVPLHCAQTALETVYQSCFLNFQGGKFGAANGVKIDGTPSNPKDTHPLEVWTGINFGIAAFLVQMGMREEALKLAETIVEQVYSNGLQFRTPEAITSAGTFRASHYLRAMAIWGIYHTLLL